jgi:hypothetical protein
MVQGISVLEILGPATPKARKIWAQVNLLDHPSLRLEFGRSAWTDRSHSAAGLRNHQLQSEQATAHPLPENKFLIGINKIQSGNLGGPLLRPLAWWWCAATFASDWLLNLAQVFGLPSGGRLRGASRTKPWRSWADASQHGSAGWAAFPEERRWN